MSVDCNMLKGCLFLFLTFVSSYGSIQDDYILPSDHIEDVINNRNFHQMFRSIRKDLANIIENEFGSTILKYDNSSDSSKFVQ